jgi:hypothetical protein
MRIASPVSVVNSREFIQGEKQEIWKGCKRLIKDRRRMPGSYDFLWSELQT